MSVETEEEYLMAQRSSVATCRLFTRGQPHGRQQRPGEARLSRIERRTEQVQAEAERSAEQERRRLQAADNRVHNLRRLARQNGAPLSWREVKEAREAQR